MLLQIAIVLSVIFQAFAAFQAIRLTKKTKFNISWIIITIGFAALMIRRVVEFLPLVSDFQARDFHLAFVWMGVLSSMFFAIGLILIRQIFNYMERAEVGRRNAEKKLLSAVISAEESERQRFAKDLHDGLGPLFSSIRMSVSALNKQVHEKDSVKIVNNVNLLTQEAIKSIKDISNNLSPHMLDNFGVKKALTSFINKLELPGSMKIHFESNMDNTGYEKHFEVIIYRVICELITNTIQHADADNISILIKDTHTNISIEYSDDGKGFNLQDKEMSASGMGLSNISSRINSLKGELSIESSKGEGTKIKIYLPLIHSGK